MVAILERNANEVTVAPTVESGRVRVWRETGVRW
jgi:hypothetical protein